MRDPSPAATARQTTPDHTASPRMSAIRVTFELATPIILRSALTLDAIILAEMAIETGRDCKGDLEDVFQATDGIPHASSALLRYAPTNGNLHKTCSRSAEAMSTLAPNPPKQIHYKHKSDLNSYRWRTAKRVTFETVAKPDTLQTLISLVHSIGTRRADGYGLIAAGRIETIHDPHPHFGLLDAKGRPARPIPLELWGIIGKGTPDEIGFARARPYYWDPTTPSEPCAMPAPPTSMACTQ